jgi:hypothetical protein
MTRSPHLSFVTTFAPLLAAFAALATACNSSSAGPVTATEDAGADVTIPGTDAGEDASPTPDATAADTGASEDSSTPVDTGTPSVDSGTSADSGSTSTDSGTSVVDSGSPPSDSGTSPDASAADAGACSSIQGTFLATAVACNGTPLDITGVTWLLTVDGSNASFSESIGGGCALVSSGGITCSSGNFSVLWSNPNTCNPVGCAMWGAQCTQTPNEWLGWTTSAVTATSFLATSETEPDGGPTPLTTCRSQGKSDPIQITWTKQ